MIVPFLNLFQITGSENSKISFVLSENYSDQSFKLSVIMSESGLISKGHSISRYLNLRGDDLLLRYGLVIDEGSDCLALSLGYDHAGDDNLASKRIKFFSKFYSFDSSQLNYIEECLTVEKPFTPRLLFFFLVQMLDESDLKKEDAKLLNLELDIILMSYVSQNFMSLAKMYDENQQNLDKLLLQDKKTKQAVRTAILYKIQQHELLIKVSQSIKVHYQFLKREESL